MTGFHYFFLSAFYFWASSTSLSLGVGYYTIYRPIMAGLITGCILNDPVTGMLAGSIVNIIYMDFVSTGGSFKGDQCLTAIIGAAGAIIFDLNYFEAAGLAYLFGFLGIPIWKYRLKINNVFVHMYEKKYREKKSPDISLYDGLYPQLLLYLMSSAVILTAFILMFFLNSLISFESMRPALHYAGLGLVVFSAFNILYKVKNKYSIFIFMASFFLALILQIKGYILLIAFGLIVFLIRDKNLLFKRYKAGGMIRKRDLAYSWFIWKNFSHSCYSYERLMGLAFAHSMKNIFKRLYTAKEDISAGIHNHTEFFNTEPNMGTPILGYIIGLEEKRRLNNETFDGANISYLKKGMMGISAGLGDSFTQVVLAPLFISMSVLLSLYKSYYLALIPILLLSALIIFISYRGFMAGYFEGRESMVARIKEVKESKIKKYFPWIFSGILGMSLGRLLFQTMNPYENIFTGLIILLAGLIILGRKRGQL